MSAESTSEPEAEQMSKLSFDEGSVRLLSSGTGAPLVYLHGVGDTGTSLPVLTALASKYKVIRPDHPGFNESDRLGVEDVADIAIVHREVLDRLGVDRFVLVGSSLGGWVATELALLAPERVSALYLIGPAGLKGRESGPDIFTMSPEETLRATIYDPDLRRAAQRSSADPVVTSRRLARNYATAYRIASSPYMHDPALPARARDLRLDTRVVWGAKDGIIPVTVAEQWAALWPHARISVIDGAGHLPHVERLDEFLDVTGLLEGRGGQWN